MKRRLIPIAALASFVFIYSCKSKPKETGTDSATTTTTQPATTPSSATEPKTYAVSFTPDTLLMGKNKEVFVKIKNAKAVALVNPDGKDEGIELTFDLDVTNKNQVGGNSIFFRTDNFRMTLDNNNNITQDNGAAEGVDAESTKELKGITYKIPPGTKPKMLNLFHEQTRVSIPVELK
ncbi:MAG: hypothetical protein JST68_17885 [Bacteroidetes bacterium]|nr:hypothetical protein [Bacteroidota bacterium]